MGNGSPENDQMYLSFLNRTAAPTSSAATDMMVDEAERGNVNEDESMASSSSSSSRSEVIPKPTGNEISKLKELEKFFKDRLFHSLDDILNDILERENVTEKIYRDQLGNQFNKGVLVDDVNGNYDYNIDLKIPDTNKSFGVEIKKTFIQELESIKAKEELDIDDDIIEDKDDTEEYVNSSPIEVFSKEEFPNGINIGLKKTSNNYPITYRYFLYISPSFPPGSRNVNLPLYMRKDDPWYGTLEGKKWLEDIKPKSTETLVEIALELNSLSDMMEKVLGRALLDCITTVEDASGNNVKITIRDFIERSTPTTQCNNTVGAVVNTTTCWICGLQIDTSSNLEALRPECEHVFPIAQSLCFTGLYDAQIRKGLNPNDSNNYVSGLIDEYGWSHRICNQVKNDTHFIKIENDKYIVDLPGTADYANKLKKTSGYGGFDQIQKITGYNETSFIQNTIMNINTRYIKILNSIKNEGITASMLRKSAVMYIFELAATRPECMSIGLKTLNNKSEVIIERREDRNPQGNQCKSSIDNRGKINEKLGLVSGPFLSDLLFPLMADSIRRSNISISRIIPIIACLYDLKEGFLKELETIRLPGGVEETADVLARYLVYKNPDNPAQASCDWQIVFIHILQYKYAKDIFVNQISNLLTKCITQRGEIRSNLAPISDDVKNLFKAKVDVKFTELFTYLRFNLREFFFWVDNTNIPTPAWLNGGDEEVTQEMIDKFSNRPAFSIGTTVSSSKAKAPYKPSTEQQLNETNIIPFAKKSKDVKERSETSIKRKTIGTRPKGRGRKTYRIPTRNRTQRKKVKTYELSYIRR